MFGTAFIFSILMVAAYGGAVNPNYNVCAKENSYCGCTGTVHIGVNTAWDSKAVPLDTAGSMCKHSTMNLGDPAKGEFKYCICDQENLGRQFVLEFCANDGEYCSCDQGLVWYGYHSIWEHHWQMGSATCSRSNIRRGPRIACVCVSEVWMP